MANVWTQNKSSKYSYGTGRCKCKNVLHESRKLCDRCFAKQPVRAEEELVRTRKIQTNPDGGVNNG